MPITAGGYRQNVLPRFGFRKNFGLGSSDWWGGRKNEAPRMPRRFADSCRFRRLSPVPACLVTQISDSEKRLLRAPGFVQAAPVASWGAATAFDSGDSRCLSQIERTTRMAVERNSLCQFWKLSNQSWGSPR